MSFASQVKAELCRQPPRKKCCAVAMAYGALLYCNTFSPREIRLVTASGEFASLLPRLFRRAFGLGFDEQPEPEAQRIAAALELYVHGSLNVFNHRTNVDINNRLVCFDIKELGKQLKNLGMLVIQDQVWNRVTVNRSEGKSTRYYVDEFHLLLRGEVGAWSVEIWKRFRKWGGIPTGITQNIKDLLASPEIENIFENSDFIYLLNQASGDRKILCERLNISTQQAAHISNAGPGEGLIFFGNVILPFVDDFPKDNELYSIMTTKLGETGKGGTAHE